MALEEGLIGLLIMLQIIGFVVYLGALFDGFSLLHFIGLIIFPIGILFLLCIPLGLFIQWSIDKLAKNKWIKKLYETKLIKIKD